MSVVDAVAQVVAWLTDGTTGVNAINGSVPGESSTAIPDVTWYNQNDHGFAARGVIERDQMTTAWIGVVSRWGDMDMGALAQDHQAPPPSIPILIRFAARDTASNTIVRQGEQLIRCARRAISAPFNDSTFSDITRNGVLFEAPRFRIPDQWNQPGDDATVGALLVLLPTLDAWALGRST